MFRNWNDHFTELFKEWTESHFQLTWLLKEYLDIPYWKLERAILQRNQGELPENLEKFFGGRWFIFFYSTVLWLSEGTSWIKNSVLHLAEKLNDTSMQTESIHHRWHREKASRKIVVDVTWYVIQYSTLVFPIAIISTRIILVVDLKVIQIHFHWNLWASLNFKIGFCLWHQLVNNNLELVRLNLIQISKPTWR